MICYTECKLLHVFTECVITFESFTTCKGLFNSTFFMSGEQNALGGSKKRHIMSGRYKYKDVKWIISDKERRKSDDCCKKGCSEMFILMK